MTTETPNSEQALIELINRLSCNDLDSHEASRIAGICLQASTDPVKALTENYGTEAAQVVQYDPQGVLAFIIFIELEDYFAAADTVDELYEQIIEAFEAPTLPDYPYDNNTFETVSDYYQWLDQELLTHHPKYRLISFGQSYSNDFQVVLVFRDDVTRILELCAQLGIDAALCE
jgi:hypothetical protein